MNLSLDALNDVKQLLDYKFIQYNTPDFIPGDPISIPHEYSQKEDIEIAGFLTAIIAWGQRKTIIKNARGLMRRMDFAPFDFICNASEKDLRVMSGFCHRTFNESDAMFFLKSLSNIYKYHGGLEGIFTKYFYPAQDVKQSIIGFRKVFLEYPHLKRSEKHVANILKGSTAKRINMFLRWMVRKDTKGVDFGLWGQIPTSALYIPLDVHVGNVARGLGLLSRKQNDWKSATELTYILRKFDPADPIKYDFALFGMGVHENKI